MTLPLVSILTPSFNQARWLVDNLRSVAQQTYPNVEHVIMDGASTDGSSNILAQAGSKIRWRSEPDRGQSHALNKAYAESSGEIIGWLNADDAFFDRTTISRVVTFLAANPEIAAVYGHGALANGDGLILHMMWRPPFDYGLLRLHNFIIQPTVFVRRWAMGDCLVDETYHFAMDHELWLRLAARFPFARLGGVLAIERHHHERKTWLRLDLLRADMARLVMRYGIPVGNRHRVRVKLLKVAWRLAGITLIRQAYTAPLAFDGKVDGVLRLAHRQVAVTRAAMFPGRPTTDAGSAP